MANVSQFYYDMAITCCCSCTANADSAADRAAACTLYAQTMDARNNTRIVGRRSRLLNWIKSCPSKATECRSSRTHFADCASLTLPITLSTHRRRYEADCRIVADLTSHDATPSDTSWCLKSESYHSTSISAGSESVVSFRRDIRWEQHRGSLRALVALRRGCYAWRTIQAPPGPPGQHAIELTGAETTLAEPVTALELLLARQVKMVAMDRVYLYSFRIHEL